jgi:signal transduction histidine kinase
LSVFTELVAAAISNAEARTALALLADEQAALRRVATLVARQASPAEIFGAVTDEACRVLESEAVGLLRFEPDGTATLVAQSDTPWDPPPLGTRFTLDGENVVTQVFRTGEVARVDDWSGSTGAVAAMADVLGVRSAVASPVVVEGALWGTIVAATSRSTPLPPDTEFRIRDFTELVATSVANAEARSQLSRLADEQAALRRVATLVAAQAAPDDIHAAVAEEVALLLAAHRCAVGRYEPDETLTVTGYWSMDGTDLPVGTQIPLEGDVVTATVRQSGRPIRIDTFDDLSGPLVDYAREVGPLPPSTVGAPIVVDGQAWGIIFVSSMTDPLPGNAESRVVLFTELVATAIVNADSRSALRELAEEQAALRRVATLVAVEASQDEIFTAVAEGVAGALGEELRLVRFEGGFAVVVAASEGAHIDVLPVGTRLPVGGNNALSRVFRTGEPTRIDDYSKASGPIAEAVQAKGLRSIVATPVVVEGRTWGAMIVGTFGEKPVPPGTENRLRQFAELMATDIANTEARAELVASRARIVAAGDEARRRIERNLHDGTQQRLLALGLDLQRARATIPDDQPEARSALSGVEQDLEGILEDLRELSHGLHPQLLSRLGLGPSLNALARRSPIPVHLDVDLTERPAPSFETALYYVVSEALTNAIKHSHASEISVTITSGGKLEASIVDDGVGDADPSGGSGLTGLLDRVDALGGRFALHSPPGGGTSISIELPVEPTLAP